MEIQTNIHQHTLNTIPEIYSKDELNRLLHAARHPNNPRKDGVGEWIAMRNHLILLITYTCSLRPLEVCSLKKTDIDLKSLLLRVPAESNKLKQGRIMTLPQELVPYIEDYEKVTMLQWWNFSHYFFPSLKADKISRDRWTEIFRQIKIDAGIHRGTPYTLRHTGGTDFYEQCGDIAKTANYMGHKDWNSTKVYMHICLMKNGYLDTIRAVQSRNLVGIIPSGYCGPLKSERHVSIIDASNQNIKN